MGAEPQGDGEASQDAPGEVTGLVRRASTGDVAAREALFALIYRELEKLARAKLDAAPTLTLLDAPALVNEVYLRIARQTLMPVESRQMFYGYAATIMRSVIVDYLRKRNSAKRRDGAFAVTLTTQMRDSIGLDQDVQRLDDALKDLAKLDDRCRKVVEMRFFAGMTMSQIAQALGVSKVTVERSWEKARAWLYLALKE